MIAVDVYMHVPDDEVTVVVINQGRDTTVGVVLSVLGDLDGVELEEARFVGKAELVEHEGDLPENQTGEHRCRRRR